MWYTVLILKIVFTPADSGVIKLYIVYVHVAIAQYKIYAMDFTHNTLHTIMEGCVTDLCTAI